jgi:hypothetical protein
MSEMPFNQEKTITPSFLGNREQMRHVLQLAAEGKVRTVVDRFPMEEATDALELLASGKLRSRVSWITFALSSAADSAAEGGILCPCFSARSSAARSEPRETS